MEIKSCMQEGALCLYFREQSVLKVMADNEK